MISNVVSRLSISLIALLLPVTQCWGRQPDGFRTDRRSDVLCGIYSVYGAAKALGRDAEFQSLIKPEYVSSTKGSTVQDLIEATESLGLAALPLKNMNPSLLKKCGCPVILFVKDDLDAKEANHYILYLGDRAGKAIVFDPAASVEDVSYGELARRWNRMGLIISDSSFKFPALRSFSLISALLIGGFCICIMFARWASWKWMHTRPPASRKLMLLTELLVLIAVTSVASSLYHRCHYTGLLRDEISEQQLTRDFFIHLLPKLSAKDVLGDLDDNGTVIVDARLARDYEAGHVPGARSIPPNTAEDNFRAALKGISPESSIILYCQSNRCSFAERVARRMYDSGYPKLSVYRNGFAEWKGRGLPIEGNNK